MAGKELCGIGRRRADVSIGRGKLCLRRERNKVYRLRAAASQRVEGLGNHREWEGRLRTAFPHVEVLLYYGGVI
jgi:hypothetical protein